MVLAAHSTHFVVPSIILLHHTPCLLRLTPSSNLPSTLNQCLDQSNSDLASFVQLGLAGGQIRDVHEYHGWRFFSTTAGITTVASVPVGFGRWRLGVLAVAPGERVIVDETTEEVARVGVDADVWQLFDGWGAIGGGVACGMSVFGVA